MCEREAEVQYAKEKQNAIQIVVFDEENNVMVVKNQNYRVRIFADFVAVEPITNWNKDLVVHSTGFVRFNDGQRYKYAKIHTSKTTKKINLLE
jgi:hypothetical protein